MNSAMQIMGIVIAGLSLLLSAITLLAVVPMRAMRAKLEAFQAQQVQQQTQAIAEIKVENARQLVDVKAAAANEAAMQIMKHAMEVQKQLTEISTAMRAVEQRLAAGHAHMTKLDDKDHQIERDVIKSLGELKEMIAGQPTKDDLNRLRDEIREEMKGHG